MMNFKQLQVAFSTNKLHHAFIFTGSTSHALHPDLLGFIKFMLGGNQITNNPNLNFINQDCSDIGIETVRNLNREKSKKSFNDGAQITVINQAHRMTTQAANALLKLLEEPASNEYLFLIAPSTTSLLPTISSRCQNCSLASFEDPKTNTDALELLNIINSSHDSSSAKKLQEYLTTHKEPMALLDTLISHICDEVRTVLTEGGTNLALLCLKNQSEALIEAQKLLQANVNLKLVAEKIIFELWPNRN